MLDITLETSNINTAMPVLADNQTLTYKVEKIEKVPAENDKPDRIKFVYKLQEPARSVEGVEILPGAYGSTYVDLVPVVAKPGSKDPEWHLKRIAAIQDAVLGTGFNHPTKPQRPKFDGACAEQMLGRTLVLKIRQTVYENRPRNEIADYIFPGDLQA